MADTLTSTELERWLGVSSPTLKRLRDREVDPLPAPEHLRDGRQLAYRYQRAAIAVWLVNNPEYPQAYKTRRTRNMDVAASATTIDMPLPRQFLAGALKCPR